MNSDICTTDDFDDRLRALVGQRVMFTADGADGPFTTRLVEAGYDFVVLEGGVYGSKGKTYTMRIECISTFQSVNELRSVP